MKATIEVLLSLPHSPENTEKKIDFLVVQHAHMFDTAKKAQEAAERAADAALKMGQRYEPLSRLQRFTAVALGAVTGGAMISLVTQIFVLLIKK